MNEATMLTQYATDFAELNTPPVISLGTIYPQALLIFLICLTYSVITPLILLFGTIYFGMGYLVYKVSTMTPKNMSGVSDHSPQ